MVGVGYAIDFIAVDERNRTSSSTSWRTLVGSEPPEIFYAFGKPVYSPVSGKVVSVHNGEPDHEARRSFLTLIPYMLGQADRIRKGPEAVAGNYRSEEHTSELQSRGHLVCRLLLEKK